VAVRSTATRILVGYILSKAYIAIQLQSLVLALDR